MSVTATCSPPPCRPSILPDADPPTGVRGLIVLPGRAESHDKGNASGGDGINDPFSIDDGSSVSGW